MDELLESSFESDSSENEKANHSESLFENEACICDDGHNNQDNVPGPSARSIRAQEEDLQEEVFAEPVLPSKPLHEKRGTKRGRKAGSSYHLAEDAIAFLVRQPIREQVCKEMYTASSLKKRYCKILSRI
jgi:hypothetical protein